MKCSIAVITLHKQTEKYYQCVEFFFIKLSLEVSSFVTHFRSGGTNVRRDVMLYFTPKKYSLFN